jgi:hypothetical protein
VDQFEDRARDFSVVRVGDHVAHERLVNFQLVERQAASSTCSPCCKINPASPASGISH